MPRTKGGYKTRVRRKRVLKQTQGYWGARRKLYAVAKETLDRALVFSYVGRKLKKRDFRKLWIQRINAAVRSHDLNYSKFIHGLGRANIELDRRALADLAVHEPKAFAELAGLCKQALA
ncbi:MAG: 50S ribosomal protein L20 [Myxococcota bacterium]|nr:50S ribosomal protein L20 [Myxococcota bacterium]